MKNELIAKMGLSVDEYQQIQTIMGREPNYTELGLFSAMWSEHCSYKNSKVLLRRLPTKGARVLQGPGEGAGIVDIGDGQAVVFKIESHNSPSAIEPFHGAATGVGGIVRDVFSMGARPVALLNSLRIGNLDNDRSKFIFVEAVKGMAYYGNNLGVPTVGGEVYFDPCYQGNPLVNAMCVGLINHEDIKKGQAHGQGNPVIYAGAPTGRDGVDGASFSSKELSDDGKGVFVIGDPIFEKALMEACLEVIQHPALVGIQDMGAAGLISSSCEMASKAGMGMELYLEKVPQCADDLIPYEIMLSESQERMLLVVEDGREGEIFDIFAKHGVQAVTIGRVTNDGMMKIYNHDELVANVSADALAEQVPEYHKPSREAEYYKQNANVDTILTVDDPNQTLKQLLAQPSIASKKFAYEQFDTQVGASTIVTPGSDAGVLRIQGTNKAIAMTVDCNGRYVYLCPRTGAAIAVAEAARNIVASGAVPLAVTDNMNFGSPENPEIFWQMEQAIDGIAEACLALDTPVIGGNVSMYNERSGSAIYPTPTIGMVGLTENADNIITQYFKNNGDLIYVLGETYPEYGGSELQILQKGKIEGRPPAIDLQVEKTNQQKVLAAIKAGFVQSAHDISEGGFAVALAEKLFHDPSHINASHVPATSQNLGADVTMTLDSPTLLFAESQSRFILSIAPANKDAFEALTGAKHIGTVNDTGKLCINNVIDASVAELKKIWEEAIPCLVK